MLFHVRAIAVSTAITFFFGISLIGWAGGLDPSTCCKRAVIGAAIAYIATVLAVRAISAILIHSMIANKIAKKEQKGGS